MIIAQAKDEQLAHKAQATLIELARDVAKEQGNPDAIKQDEHRGATVHSAGEGHLAVVGQWLIVSNKKPLVLAVLDSYHGQGETLAADQQFQTVRKPDQFARLAICRSAADPPHRDVEGCAEQKEQQPSG